MILANFWTVFGSKEQSRKLSGADEEEDSKGSRKGDVPIMMNLIFMGTFLEPQESQI